MLTARRESEKRRSHARYRDGERQRRDTVPNVEFTLKRGDASPRNAGRRCMVMWWRWTISSFSRYLFGCYAE